ncbi:MAG: AraC family transcriptional regulator [Christensenellales bacterium]
MRDSQFIDRPDSSDMFFQRPRVNYCGRLLGTPEYYLGLGEHIHDCTEVSICIKGKGFQVLNNQKYAFSSGCMVMLNPQTAHYDLPDKDDPPAFLFMGIDNYAFSFLPRNTIRLEEQSPVLRLHKHRKDIETYFMRLIDEVLERKPYYKSMSSTLASLILMLAMRERGDGIKRAPTTHTQRAKEYIDCNYTSPLNLTSISETVYISKSYLSHIFKSDMGVSPIEYLIGKRIAHAKELLKNTSRLVADIAAEVGYDDPEYFTQLFRHVEGIPPTKYRALAKKGKQ